MPAPRIAFANILRKKAAQLAISRPTADESAVRAALSMRESRKAEGAVIRRTLTTAKLADRRGRSGSAVKPSTARRSSPASRSPSKGR
jgi:hypothetical protein